MRIVDTAFSGAFNRNKPMDEKEVYTKDLTDLSDCYATYFSFGSEFKDHVLKTGSIKGYKGSYIARYLPFDIDNNNLEEAKKQAVNLINRLQMYYDLYNADIQVFFTGAKGFHIQIPQEVFGGFVESPDLACDFRRMALELSSGIVIDTAIYESMRLWRIPNTKNGKTGLYKISLSVMELYDLSIEEIKELAKNPRDIIPADPTHRENLHKLYITKEVKKPITERPVRKLQMCPPNEKKCIYHILNASIPEGERNNALLRLAVYFKNRFSKASIVALLTSWNIENDIGLSNDEINRTISSSLNEYDFGCNDGLLSKYCDSSCSYKLRKKEDLQGIKTIDDLNKSYKAYIRDIDSVKIDLSKWLPKFSQASRGITAGEVVMLLAGSGVGKTAFLQNFIWQMRIPTMFFSYELPEVLTYERFYQIVNDCPGEVVEDHYKKDNVEFVPLQQELRDIYFTFDSGIKVDDIPQIVALVEEKKKTKIRVVAIDYLGLIKGGRGSRYERVSYIAETLKDIAKKTNSVVFCVAQVSRSQGAMGSEDLTLTSGKDSGSIENTGDLVLGMSRPNKSDNKEGIDNDYIIRINILKNRKGRDNTHIDCMFDKNTLRITEL